MEYILLMCEKVKTFKIVSAFTERWFIRHNNTVFNIIITHYELDILDLILIFNIFLTIQR